MILLVQAFPDVFGSALQPVCAALLACIAIALPFVWMGERGVRPGPAADLLRVAWPGLADRPAQAMPFLEFYACRDLASDQSFP